MIQAGGPLIQALLGALQLGLATAGFYGLLRHRGYTLAEAASAGLMAALMSFSFILQADLIAGGGLAPGLLGGLALFCLCLMIRYRRPLARSVIEVAGFIRSHRMAAPLAGAMAVLGILAFLSPLIRSPGICPRHLGRFDFWDLRHGIRPLNHMALWELFHRLHPWRGVGLIGYSAWASIGFSTYALARRYAWPPTAFTVAMIALSLPRLALHSQTPGCEILPAAAALFCLMTLYRLVEVPDMGDMGFLMTGIAFSVSAGPLFAVLPAILCLTTAVLLFRRHGADLWRHMIRRHPAAFAALLIPALLFSGLWLPFYNGSRLEPGMPTAAISANDAAIAGTAANLGRYLLESFHLTQPVDRLWLAVFHVRWTDGVQWLHDRFITRYLGDAGAAVPFFASWRPTVSRIGYGPLAFLLILPALLAGLLRGNRRLKALAVGLFGYLYVIALAAAWRPENIGFLTPFFTCGTFFIAFLLPPWRLTRAGRRLIQALCLALIAYAGWIRIAALITPGALH